MSTFSQVYKPYTFGGGEGVCENQHIFCTLNFLARFLLFSWGLWGGRGSQKVYGLYTHENVDTYGRPLVTFLSHMDSWRKFQDVTMHYTRQTTFLHW